MPRKWICCLLVLLCAVCAASASASETNKYKITPYDEYIDAKSASTGLLRANEEKATEALDAFPRLTYIRPSADVLTNDGTLTITLIANQPGTLSVQLFRYELNMAIFETELAVPEGETQIDLRALTGELFIFEGDYAVLLTLTNDEGMASMQHQVPFEAMDKTAQLADFDKLTTALYDHLDIRLSPPYSDIDDGSYWAMHPGELDDEAIWNVLMQPITVYDDGRMSPISHVYMRANPDGTGARVAQIHGLSQGLHVIGEPNEYGYVLCEAFSNFDPDYTPISAEETAYAFELRQGYLLAKNLKTIEVEQDIAFVIDKLTQRMYMFRYGQRVTEFVISTGKITAGKYYYETIAGEFITIGHASGYWSGDLYSDMPIRFNGGTMLHEVPFTLTPDGYRNYSLYESKLGTKHSSGCVRVPYWFNDEGYNHEWIWRNLTPGNPYKIIIWDDRNRNDAPKVWRN